MHVPSIAWKAVVMALLLTSASCGSKDVTRDWANVFDGYWGSVAASSKDSGRDVNVLRFLQDGESIRTSEGVIGTVNQADNSVLFTMEDEHVQGVLTGDTIAGSGRLHQDDGPLADFTWTAVRLGTPGTWTVSGTLAGNPIDRKIRAFAAIQPARSGPVPTWLRPKGTLAAGDDSSAQVRLTAVHDGLRAIFEIRRPFPPAPGVYTDIHVNVQWEENGVRAIPEESARVVSGTMTITDFRVERLAGERFQGSYEFTLADGSAIAGQFDAPIFDPEEYGL